ncbi:MAG: hypothetical protein ACO1TE_12080 [Prosthecobacter sp.]
MLILRLAAGCRCLLLAGAWLPSLLMAQTDSPAPVEQPSWKERINDPAFRKRVEHADGVEQALQELAIPEAEHAAFYEWLEGQVKPPGQHKIECLLRARLARDLRRPEKEVSAADDLVLQAAPDLPQGWFGRAELYESGRQKESATWAAEASVQGMRRVDLASTAWRWQLHAYHGVDWLAHAVKTGGLGEWTKAVAHAVEDAPRGAARPETCELVLGLLRHETVRKDPNLCQVLVDAMAATQPQLVLGDPGSFAVVMRDLRTAGHADAARRLARLLVFAPTLQDPAQAEGSTDEAVMAMELLRGFHELLGMWEDTTPPYQPTTVARQILQTAMPQDGASFAEECLMAAQAQPWNENLVTHALLAQALNGGVSVEQMGLAAGLSAEGRARVALRLAAFAPEGSHPQTTSGPWMEELALGLVTKMQSALERSSFETFLNCVEGLARHGEKERLNRVLDAAAAKNSAPRLDDLDHWERYAQLVLGQRNLTLTRGLATAWGGALDQSSEQKEHLLPLTRAAILAGRNGGVEFAMMALTLWEHHHAEMSTTLLPPAGEAARVGEALMACDYLEGFGRFVDGLEQLQKHRITSSYAHLTRELSALRDLLAGKGGRVPDVEAWARPPAGPGEALTIEWQFVLPEFASLPNSPQVLTTGDRDGRTPADKLRDARWWRAGTPLPSLARLSGKWDLEIQAGEGPDKLRTLATVPRAAANGSYQVITLPVAGCFKTVLRAEERGMHSFGQPRPFSTLPVVFATGREPAAAEEVSAVPSGSFFKTPQPESWKPEDTHRWGRLIAPPVALHEDVEEYLLTEWPDKLIGHVRMILLDVDQLPLGPVPVASTGWQEGTPNLTHTPANRTLRQRVQRFRPGDWAGDGDLVFPSDGRAGEQKARYIAFVSREVLPQTVPLLQLRPYHAVGTPFRSATPELPQLNDEHIGDLGFAVHSWHVTFASDRGIITGKGALAGFDVMHVPWKPLVRAESELIEGNEWPMCFTQEHSLVIEPPWKGTRNLGLRFVPFDSRGQHYPGCRRIELPLPNYNRGEISEWMDGAVLLVSSQRGASPEPACAWVEPDGRCHVVKLPREAPLDTPGLEVAWWGPGGTVFTLHEDGMLYHMEHRDGLRLLKAEPGSPDDMPEGATPGRSQRKRAWRLERPDVLVHMDKKTQRVLHRYHLPKPCAGTPMAFDSRGYVILFTTEHEIIRVNPPGVPADDD